MKELTFADFVKEHGQTGAATLLGVTQGAVRKALLKGRDIRVKPIKGGGFEAYELRPFPSIDVTRVDSQ